MKEFRTIEDIEFDLEMTRTYCYVCKGQVNTIEEIKKKPYKRKIWKCTLCNTILGTRGLK